jgi:hypothetical protein
MPAIRSPSVGFAVSPTTFTVPVAANVRAAAERAWQVDGPRTDGGDRGLAAAAGLA